VANKHEQQARIPCVLEITQQRDVPKTENIPNPKQTGKRKYDQ